jgi:hypothetical protein
MMNDLSMNLLRIENEKLKDEIRQVNEAKREADVCALFVFFFCVFFFWCFALVLFDLPRFGLEEV